MLGDAEVAADFLDELVDGAALEVELKLGVFQALVELAGEGFRIVVMAFAVYRVLDAADELGAGGGTAGLGYGWGGDVPGQEDRAAVEGYREVERGVSLLARSRRRAFARPPWSTTC